MAAYTSSDEFDLERRVWMTNETPVYDIYKALNSSMQTPFWKWLLGTSKVEYNLPYRIYSGNTNSYVHDEDSDEVYLKMTNGQISSNYGPNVSSDSSDANFNPTYNRIEIDGVLLPEFDLMLHEVYRYLETIYPDHPDERKLLTDNEFNDTILAAADMINYSPDVKFFDEVAKTVATGLTTDEINEESAKIKIRNLINDAFRRKLYGSKAGYRMFANDIFQLCTIFPVATYIPIMPVEQDIITRENNTLGSKAALNAFNMTKDEYLKYARKNNRTIDTYSELYYRKFRLTDWDGQNSSYLQKDDENTYLFGYSIPCNENRIYEYPNASDTEAVLDDVTVGSTISNSLDYRGITYVTDQSDGVFQIETSTSKSLSLSDQISANESTSSTKEVHYIATSHDNAILYQQVKEYLSVDSILDIVKDAYGDDTASATSLLNQIRNSVYGHYIDPSSLNFFSAIYNTIKTNSAFKNEIFDKIKPANLNVIANPYVESTVLLEPSKSISYYPDELPTYEKVMDETTNEATGEINVDADTPIVDTEGLFGKYIGNIDLTESSSQIDYLYIITGFTKGSISYEIDSNNTASLKEMPSLNEDNRYGFVIDTNNGDKVVVFGNLKVSYTLDVNNAYAPTTATLNITHIPETKPDNLIRQIYSDYSDILSAKQAVENDIAEKYTIAGYTEDGCKDLITLFNASSDDYIERTSLDNIAAKTLYTYNGGYYYKTYDNITVSLGTSFTNVEDNIIEYYRQATGKNYVDYIKDYLELEVYNTTLDSYRKNREYMYEISSYTPDQDSDEYIEFEQSTIRPGNTIEKIVEMADTSNELIFSDTIFNDGTISEYSLGNLSVYPVINNGSEYISVMETDGSDYSYIEDNCKTYSYNSNNGIIYWPHYKFFDEGNIHNTTKVTLNNAPATLRLNNNSQLYTLIADAVSSDNKTAGEWFANCQWYDSGEINNNITISPTETTSVKIEGVVDITNEDLTSTITFTDATSIERFKSLSIGDTVYGPTIDSDDNDVYITSIGYNSVTVSQEFTQSGTFQFTFNCKLNIIADESDDMMQYKDNLDSYGEYSIINPFEHGLWGSSSYPYVSNAILESLPDISFYKPYNYITTADSTSDIVDSFYEVMDKIHPIKNNSTAKRVPSTIKFMNDLFVELNITKVLSTTTRSGSTKALMSVDWLDYLSNSLTDISRATDKANVGVNLMMETDCSGYYTMSTTLSYTDPNVQLKFITMNFKGIQSMWNNNPINSNAEWTVPAYAQIGTGGSGRYSWFTSPADVTYPNIWGNNVFDSTAITDSEITTLENNNGRLRKRSTWGNDDSEDLIETSSNTRYQSVEKPLFEIPLGEYDVQTRYLPSDNSDMNMACTTVQSSFYAQTFNNLTKYISSVVGADDEIRPIVLNNTTVLKAAPINFIEGIDSATLSYLGTWTPTLGENEDKTKYLETPSLLNIGNYYTIDDEILLSDAGYTSSTGSNSEKFKDHSIYIKTSSDNTVLYEPVFMGTITDTLVKFKDDLKAELAYVALYAKGKDVSASNDNELSNKVMSMLSDITEDGGTNKIYWFILSNSIGNSTFAEQPSLGVGSIVGLLTPSTVTAGKDINNYKYMIFNRGYFTATLPIVKPTKVIEDNEYYKVIESVLKTVDSDYVDISPLADLDASITTIKLPRKCITEGSYNFDYIIDAGITCTGYLYGTSASNGVSYEKDEDDTNEYDYIENDNFDIVTDEEVTFNVTRGAIYKDEDNDEFYVFTDKYTDSDGNSHTCDPLKKVAIKFEEQKYFKNTTYLTGTYKTVSSLASGSSVEVITPTLYQLTDAGEFNTTLISPNDRILRITSMDLRSIYNSYLEPILFSNYYDISGMVRGIDKDGKLVVSYDNTIDDQSEKLLFGVNLKNIIPVDKSYDSTSGSYVITAKDETYFDFENSSEYNAPTVYNDSVKFTKSIISDNKSAAVSDYEFKYFKNLLVLKAAISTTNPNKIIPAEGDNGQFDKAIQYIQVGDKVVSGVCLTTTGTDNLSDLHIKYNGKSILGDNIQYAYYNANSKSFICATNTKIGIASNVSLPNDNEINLDYYGQPKVKNLNEERSLLGTIEDISCDSKNWLITVESSNSNLLYSLPFDADSLILSEAYNEYKTYNSTASVIKLPLETYESVADNTVTYNDAYANVADLSIKSVSGDNYTIEPYAINYDSSTNTENGQKFYKADNKTGLAVYCSGRDTFIKSPVYITTSDGSYTDQVSSNNYWKYTRIPLLNETNYSIYQSIISAQSVIGGYKRAESIRTSIVNLTTNFDYLKDNVRKNSSGKYIYSGSVSSGVTLAEDELPAVDQVSDSNVKVALTELETNYGINQGDNNLTEVMDIYYNYYCILKNLRVMPWSSTDNSVTTISSFISSVKNSNISLYYYFDLTSKKFVVKSNAPSITAGNPSTYVEYLKGEKDSDGNCAITYYGIGPYNPAKVTVSDESYVDTSVDTIDNIYGSDLTFSSTMTFTSKSDSDSNWYAEYLSNITTYGFMDDNTTAICTGAIKNVLFTTDNIVFITTGGNIVYIAKEDTYKAESLQDASNWHTAELPSGLYYDYISSSSSITKTIKYGDGKTFDLRSNIALIYKPIYEVSSIYSKNNDIVIGGYIKARKDIESEWSAIMDSQGYETTDDEYTLGLSNLTTCISNAKFFYSTTPFVLYSNDGGMSMSMGDMPEDLPNFIMSSSSKPITLATSQTSFTDGAPVLLSQTAVTLYQNSKKLDNFKTIITSAGTNNTNYVVYDNIKYISGNYSLSSDQTYGLTVAGIVYETPNTYKLYLAKTDSNETAYEYMLKPELNNSNLPDFSNIQVYDIEDNLKSLATAYSVPYSTFTMFVNPEGHTVKISSTYALNFAGSVTGVSNSDITFADNIISSSSTGGSADVLLSFETKTGLTILDQKDCINTKYLSDYFDSDTNECLVSYIKQVSNSGSADGVYNYQETLVTHTEEGYPSLAQDKDGNHVFYEYDTVSDVDGNTIYSEKEFDNASGNPIYLVDSDGNYINQASDSITSFSLYQICHSSSFDSSILSKAASPAYDSVSDAVADSSLREEDTSWKEYFNVSKIASINANQNLIPYSYSFNKTNGIETIKSGNCILKTSNGLEILSSGPDIYIGEDLTTFDVNKALNAGSLYYKYTPSGTFTINKNSFIYKNNDGVINLSKKAVGTVIKTVSVSSDLNFDDIAKLNDNCIKYTGEDLDFIDSVVYIIHNLDNNTYSITTDKPSCGIEITEQTTINIELLSSSSANYQRKYTGPDYIIRKGAYIVKSADKIFFVGNPQTSGEEKSNIIDAINITKGTYSKYTGEDYSIPNNSYITKDDAGSIGFTTTSPLVDDKDISKFDINAFLKIEDGHFAKYTGETETIYSGDFIINNNGTYSKGTVEPTSEEGITDKGEREFSLNNLPNENEYIKVTENVTITNGSFILHNGTYSITDVPQMYSSNDISSFNLQDLYDMDNNTFVKYTGAAITISKNSYIIHSDISYIESISSYSSYTASNMSTFDLNEVSSMAENSYIEYTGSDYSIYTGNYILKLNNTISITTAPQKIECEYINIKELSNYDIGTYVIYTGKDFSIIDKNIKLDVSSNIESLADILYTEDDESTLSSETDYLDALNPSIPSVEFASRFSLVAINNSEDKYYYDNYLGYFPIKIIRYIELKANIGYSINQSQVYYTQKSMHDISSTTTDMPNAVTSIYLPQRGYGGSRLRTEQSNSWSDELPWEVDPTAFMDCHLTNAYGEKVTLCDSDGNEILADRGEYPVSIDDTVSVPTGSLNKNSSFAVSLTTFDETSQLSNSLSSVNIYRPASSTEYLWATQDEVYIDVTKSAGTTQKLLGLYKVSPSEFGFSPVDGSSAVIEYSYDNSTFVTTGAYTFDGNILQYTTPNTISIQPSYLKITLASLSITIKLSYSSVSNKVYNDIIPAFYTYIDNTYVVISRNTEGTFEKYYSLDNNKVTLQDSSTSIASSDVDENDIVYNLPIFQIDAPKTYFMFDPAYTDSSASSSITWLSHFHKEFFLGSHRVSQNNITCSIDASSTTDSVIVVCTYESDTFKFTFDKNTIKKPTSSDTYLSLKSNYFVATSDDPIEFTVKSTSSSIDNLYVTGAKGPIYMRMPSYGTFKDLIANEQYIIKGSSDLYNASSIKNGTDSLTSVTFNNIETNKVTFNDVLPISSLNDGNNHFIRIEVLTQKTVPTTRLNMYGNDYEAISLSDMDIFPPDRVYFNPKGYPSSPVIINNKVYNKDNNIYYTSSLFTNNNSKAINECDENGKFIKYVVSDGEAVKSAITIADSVDSLFTPNKPNYTSCKDWFEGEFYVSGHESNPFWQVINLTSKFNSVNQIWTQNLTLNKFEKAGKSIKQVEVDDSEAYLILNKGSYYEEFDGDLKQYYNCDYLNLFDGKIRFIALEPTASMYNSTNGDSQIIKYGICANNTVKDTFHPSASSNIPGYLQSSYTVNSRKNYANPNEADSAIVEVTEMGLFNKAHVLIAYAVFPPIEYRSDTQHVSFTSFIKYGNCTVTE